MKIYKLVNVLGALNDTGKLASDMYELGKKRYYSKEHQQEIPVSEMDFQHMVRAFVKQNDEVKYFKKLNEDSFISSVDDLDKIESLKEDIEVYKTQIANNDTQEYHNLHDKIAKLEELIEEKEKLLEKEILQKDTWRNAYYDECSTKGSRYIFTEIPNNEYGKKLTRGMKVYLNDESYTMRVRGQHIKPELRGTGASYWGQSIEESTHLRVYIDKKKGA